MDRLHQQFVQRAPRITIEDDKLKESGVDLGTSECRLVMGDGSELQPAIISIVNISTGGIKLTLVNPDSLNYNNAEITLRINAPGAGTEYNMKGTVCWAEHLTGGNSWVGIELKPRPDVLRLFTALTGEQP